ncbi:phosphatase PAP2 family protein [Desulfomonile tiedjei]|uniref:PAP2 superfamily protein n=1 Tax=Desulfomonile tiedjei (strain ATCC 49306 / DSM 6799 / DCB-1) TaxID=706587 RepID=I4C5V7_DESTA|nr:phosphatase PAP2 family protein [Desulfomonile tiedjei]AFM24948.1 PAP2 superfamily protein [Desulfomonile tiedjei DSM 6799]
MKTKDVVWLVLLIMAILLTICLNYYPYLPGDVSSTRLIQSLLPESKHWAQVLSSTAKSPFVFILIAITFALSWVIAGWRAALLSVASFIGLWLLGTWLGPVISQPRPSPELVQVTEASPGSAFPSIFAFNFMATVGFLAVLAGVKASGGLRWGLMVICISLLIIGGIARIALAAHWPSDVAISYLIGLLWITLLIRFI